MCEGAYLPEETPGQTAIIAGKGPVYQTVRVRLGEAAAGKPGGGGELHPGSWAGEAWHRGGSRKKGLVTGPTPTSWGPPRLRPLFHPPRRPGRFALRPRCRPPRNGNPIHPPTPSLHGQGDKRGPHAPAPSCPPSRRRSHRGPGRLGLGWQFLGGRPRERRAPAARSLGWVEIQPQPCVGQAGFPGPIPGPRFARPGIAIPIPTLPAPIASERLDLRGAAPPAAIIAICP